MLKQFPGEKLSRYRDRQKIDKKALNRYLKGKPVEGFDRTSLPNRGDVRAGRVKKSGEDS